MTRNRIQLSRGHLAAGMLAACLAAAGGCVEDPLAVQTAELDTPSPTRNLALDPGTTAFAQSTFPGYAAARAVDGDTSTVQSAAKSWANAHASAPNGKLPQWFEVDLAEARELTAVNLYTSAGYPLRDYDVEAWDGDAWQLVAQQRGNTQLEVTHVVGPLVASKVRVICLAGPVNQSVYARINELELIGRDTGPSATSTVLQAGEDWRLVHIDGTDDSGASSIHENIALVTSGPGLASSPLPQILKDNLADEAPDQVVIVSDTIAQDLVASLAQGALTPRLAAIAEPEEPDDLPATARKKKNKCPDQQVTHSRGVSFNGPFSKQWNLAAGLNGQVALSGGVQAQAQLNTHFTKKRVNILGWCVVYGSRFDGADVSGSGSIQQGATLSGTLDYSKDWEWDVAKINLGGVLFMVGPVPVYLDFKLPIQAGLELDASATGTVQYNGNQAGTASFNASCSASGCGGSGSWNLTAPPGQPLVNGSLSARVKAVPWVDVAFRVSLYHEDLVHVQAGLRPELHGDLWGYAGNACGDADQNGANEMVKAITVDVDGELHVTAAAAFLKTVAAKKWDLWHWSKHILFARLNNDASALQPMITGPASPVVGVSQPYALSMRPCWPYDDKVTYSVATSGTPATVKGGAHAATPVSLGFPTAGAANITTVAVKDEHGRDLGATTVRTVTAVAGTWTSWLNRDSTGGNGDYELLSEFVLAGQSCANPIAVQCQTLAGVDYTQTGQVYTCSPTVGGVCVKANQSNGVCSDYRVRFLCP